MQYRILGPLEALRAGRPLDLGSPKQRAVLAALVLEAGRVVPTGRLVEQVWGDEPPANVAASLQAYVSNLRRILREDTATSPIVRQLPGYRLDLTGADVDLEHFLARAEAARAAVQSGAWVAAVRAADDALGLWRGELLADLRDEEWVRLAAVGVAERRTACVEDLVTGLLGAGRTTAALGQARRLYDEQPLRERACWLFLLALYRDGRTSEALTAYRGHAQRLDEELGLEPGPALRDLQGAMLRQDDDLARWPATSTAATPSVVDPAPAGAPGPLAATDRRSTGLVGRTDQLAVVDAALAEVVAGACRWLVLSGPAGIGKTRLAEEAALRAQDRGAALVRAGCPDDEGVPPWWPIAQIVRALGADPARILAQDPDAEADRARFAVYERVCALLTEAAAPAPLAVVIDDVQWADPSSLGLLAHLAFALDGVPVALVLTARDGVVGSDLRRLLDAVSRRTGTRRLAVPPLAGAEVRELVRQVSGEDVDADEAVLLSARTGGNPFFVSEYARLPRAERTSGEIPLAVRSVLGRRLDALDAGALQVVRTAAVIGDVLDVGLLTAVTRLDADELADLLDEAADERIIVVAAGSQTYAFAHGLLRDEVLAGMSDARRQRLHARVAAAVGAGGSTEDLVRRAGHLVAALPLADPVEALAACQAAARDADEHWQTDAAAHWWQEALTTYDLLPAARRDPDGRDRLVRRRLDALVRSGRGQTVYELVDAEVRDVLREGRPSAVGHLCSSLIRSAGAWPWAAFGQDPGPLLGTLQMAEPQVAGDPAVHARLLAALAVGSCYSPDGTVPDTLSRRALDLAEALGDGDVLADALLGRALTFSGIAARARESEVLLDRLAQLPHGDAEIDAVLRHGLMTMVSATLGDMDACAEHCRSGVAGSDALRLSVSRVQFRLTESMLALWQGRFAEAETLFDDAVRQREQTELYFGWAPMAVVVLRWKQGQLLSLGEEAAGKDEAVEQVCLAVARGDTPTADRLIGAWLARPAPVIWTSHGSWTLLAHMTADAGLRHHAPRLLELLQPLSGLVAVVGQLTMVGPVSLALARLHHLLGDDRTARRELAAATELAVRSGGRPSQLRCRLFAVELDGPRAGDDLLVLADEADAAGLDGVAAGARALLAASG